MANSFEVNFPHCLVLNSHVGTSKAGNQYTRFSFLDEDGCEVYDLIQSGDAGVLACSLAKGDRASLSFRLVPAFGGEVGVRVMLVGLGRYDSEV